MLSYPGYRKKIPVMSLEFPFEYADVEGLGRLFYPVVRLQIKTTSGWREFKFLVDTGADVTSIPLEVLSLIGVDHTKLPVSKTFGVGGCFIKTYDFELNLMIGTVEILVRASAIDNEGKTIPFLLGRKDIFESIFSLQLDSKRKVTIISNNKP